jgi:transposase
MSLREKQVWMETRHPHVSIESFELLQWPPHSPATNPIEYMWRVVKAKLYQYYTDTSVLPGALEKVREVLEERLRIVWQDIGAEVLERLILSKQRREDALYQAKGSVTEY